MHMVKGLMLTNRDTKMLYDCYQNVTLSFSQIRQRHFPHAKQPTVCNRLSKLKAAALLSKQRVGIILYQGDPEEIGTVYQVTRRGIAYLRLRYPNEYFREESVRLNTSSLAHDLLLTNAISALRERYPTKRVIHGRVFRDERARKMRIPDAVIVGESGALEAAVELELTAKSERRYHEIITQYRLTPEFPKVLYIVGAESISEKIKFQITGMRPMAGLAEHATGKFYFVQLDELKNSPRSARIANGTQSGFLAA